MNRRSLRLESLEDRLTPATKGAPILPPPTVSHGAAQVIVINQLPTSGSSSGTAPGQGMHPAIGIPFGNSGSSGSSNSGGSGLGTSTGDPVGPGPGN
jgi:hypothetical protein